MKLFVITAILLASACAKEDVEPGTPVSALDPDVAESILSMQEGAQELRASIERSENWTVDEFLSVYERDATPLAYDATTATNLDLISSSTFAPTEDEVDSLAADGFVMTAQEFPSFAYGYATIYAEDLPVFVSADSIMFAIHRSLDTLLADIERSKLTDALIDVLNSMRSRLYAGDALGFTATQETDLDVYLAVALSLAIGTQVAPQVGGDAALAAELFDSASSASGDAEQVLFGTERTVDWSQFKPRGHYAGDEQLERYFRATMWLSRIDFRILEQVNGELVFNRRQFYDTLALAALLDENGASHYRLLSDTVGAFIGEPDGLTVDQLPELFAALGVDEPAEVKSLSDDTVTAVLQKHQLGAQRISSHYMKAGLEGTAPLSHSFTFLSQRYVLDSHVLSNLVYDRVGNGDTLRMMPDPLDVAFAALGNDDAATLLEPDLRTYQYQHDLNAMRVLADAHPESYWQDTLYTAWMNSLRSLSAPSSQAGAPATDAWRRRALNTQLASWAELRHDTMLYVKQSYSAANACEYPDAYVEPNPDFFAKVAAFAELGADVAGALDPRADSYFAGLRDAALRLERMATAQESGAPHSADDIAWINQAVTLGDNCGTPNLGEEGWYADLFFANDQIDFDPTIADIHTQPTDEGGNPVGRVLHVGTGNAQAMIVTVQTCEGPRAYVGLASTYYEAMTEDYYRLNDEEWAVEVQDGDLVRPDWAP